MSTAMKTFRWSSGGASDAGKIRQINQDAFLDRPDLGLWAVADGMGGHSAGERASHLLVEQLGRLGHFVLLGAAVEGIRQTLGEVNGQLLREARALGRDLIGSTIVILTAIGDHCAILWVGDSRAYRLRHGHFAQLTTDHTQVQHMLTQGLLTAEQAKHHPWAHVLSRAIGGDAELKVDYHLEALGDGDRFLLCSDGLDKELDSTQIAQILGRSEPTLAAQALITAACDAGGRDNVTAVVVDFSH